MATKTYDVSKAREARFDVFDRDLDPDDVLGTVRLAAKTAAEAWCGYHLDDPEYEVRRLYAWPTDAGGMSGTYYVEVRWYVNREKTEVWYGEVDVRPAC